MRILVVQESDWLKRGPHQSHHLMERLSLRGHEVRVIDFEIDWRQSDKREIASRRQVFTGVHRAVKENRVTVIRPPIVKLPVLDYASLVISHLIEIKRQMDEFRPEVVVGFGILNASIALRLCKERGVPFVYYIIDELHRLVPQEAFRGLARRIEMENMRRADLVLSINEGLRDYTIRMGADRARTEVIRAGVDLERFRRADGRKVRERYGFREGDLVLFFMGWLYDFSGLREAALELSGADPRVKMLVLGKGDLWETLQEIRRERGLEERIITVPWVPYEEVSDYLAAADVCILPAYRNEIMMNIVPIKIYEYMAAGKPVIATKLPGLVREFGEGSGVVYINEPREVVGAAVDLVREGGALGKRGREWTEKCSWESLLGDFERLLEGCRRTSPG